MKKPGAKVGRTRRAGISFSALYFSTFFGMGVYFCWGNVFLNSIGVNVQGIGMLNSLYFLAVFLCHPVFGYVYDRVVRKYFVMVPYLTSAAVAVSCVLSIPSSFSRAVVSFTFSAFGTAITPLLDTGSLGWCNLDRVSFQKIRVWFIYTASWP